MKGDVTESIVEETAVNEMLLPMLTFSNVWVAGMEAQTA